MVTHRLLLALEIVCLLALVAGIALVSIPAALVVGGALGVLAVERATARPPADTQKGRAR